MWSFLPLGLLIVFFVLLFVQGDAWLKKWFEDIKVKWLIQYTSPSRRFVGMVKIHVAPKPRPGTKCMVVLFLVKSVFFPLLGWTVTTVINSKSQIQCQSIEVFDVYEEMHKQFTNQDFALQVPTIVDAKKSFTSWCGRYPMIWRVSYMSGGAGFRPSTDTCWLEVRDVCFLLKGVT